MAEQHGQGSYPSGQQGGYGGGYSEPYGAKLRNGMAVAALVLAVIALLTCWIFLGLPLAIVGLVLGIVAMRRAKRGLATNRGTAIAAVVVNAVALLPARSSPPSGSPPAPPSGTTAARTSPSACATPAATRRRCRRATTATTTSCRTSSVPEPAVKASRTRCAAVLDRVRGGSAAALP